MRLYRNHFPYLIGSDLDLEKNDINHLVKLFEQKPDLATEILGGRNAVVKNEVVGIPMIIKFYKRGGLIRHIMHDVYFRSGKVRSLVEYEMLKKAAASGVKCPEPLVWATRGNLFYKAFLVTREIENSRTLVDMSSSDTSLFRDALEKTAEQTKLLIENRIHHVDLHPGNVLVDNSNEVYLIDFDKAHESSLSRDKLTYAIINRWKRAVVKYKLPAETADVFENRLKSQLLL